MHWCDVTTKPFRRFSAIKNTYWHALVGPQHKLFSVIFSYQECILTCIGRNLTQNLFDEFQLSRMHINMHWCDFTTKSFRRFSAIKNAYSHAMTGPKQKNFFSNLQRSRILMDVHWWDLNTKSFRRFSAIKNAYSHAMTGPKHKIFSAICSDQGYLWMCIGGTLTQNLFGDFQLSRILIDMQWWDMNTKSLRRFSAIKNTYWHALVVP